MARDKLVIYMNFGGKVIRALVETIFISSSIFSNKISIYKLHLGLSRKLI
jgi:hypothetical protein